MGAEETPRTRAKRALEAALLGEGEEDSRRASAKYALEAALLGDLQCLDDLDPDTPRARAKQALEAALLEDLGHLEAAGRYETDEDIRKCAAKYIYDLEARI